MVNGPLVRNSRILGVLADIVRGPLGTFSAVEVAGRGIAAEARCTLAVLADKMLPDAGSREAAVQAGLAFADRLMEFGAIEDDLADLWRRRREEDVDDAAFEAELHRVVARLEAWPQQLTK